MSKQTEKKIYPTSIRFTGQEGGDADEDGFMTMGCYTGNLWEMALRYKHPKFHLNSMLCSMFVVTPYHTN